MENEVFNIEQVSKYLHCSTSEIRKLVRNKQIPSYRIGSRLFFRKSSIDLWIKNQEFYSMQDSNYEVKIKPLESEVNKNESNKKGSGFYIPSNS